jgi:hypothetical protein
VRSLSRVVGVVMALAGLAAVILGIVSIGRFVSDLTTSGSFGCRGESLCDPIGDAPTLIGGGIVLMVVGLIIASLGSAMTGSRRGGSAVPNTLMTPAGLTDWTAGGMAGQRIATEIAPMVRQVLQSLETGGLLAGNVAATRSFESMAGQTAATAMPHDAAAHAERDRRLRATGTLAQAVVDSFRELPLPSVDGQLYELHLDVRPENGPSYQVRHYELVPTRWAYRVTDGASFPAWVDPADPSRLLIEWERS